MTRNHWLAIGSFAFAIAYSALGWAALSHGEWFHAATLYTVTATALWLGFKALR